MFNQRVAILPRQRGQIRRLFIKSSQLIISFLLFACHAGAFKVYFRAWANTMSVSHIRGGWGGGALVQPLPFSYHCSMARVSSRFLRFLFFVVFFPLPPTWNRHSEPQVMCQTIGNLFDKWDIDLKKWARHTGSRVVEEKQLVWTGGFWPRCCAEEAATASWKEKEGENKCKL